MYPVCTRPLANRRIQPARTTSRVRRTRRRARGWSASSLGGKNMIESRPSRTAQRVAIRRAAHHLL